MGFLQIGMGMIIISQQPGSFREMNLRETVTKIGCQTSITKGKYLSIKALHCTLLLSTPLLSS
jgi:hypothetical protein